MCTSEVVPVKGTGEPPSWNKEVVASSRGWWEEPTSEDGTTEPGPGPLHDLSEQSECPPLTWCVRERPPSVVFKPLLLASPRFSSQTCTLSDAPSIPNSPQSGPNLSPTLTPAHIVTHPVAGAGRAVFCTLSICSSFSLASSPGASGHTPPSVPVREEGR